MGLQVVLAVVLFLAICNEEVFAIIHFTDSIVSEISREDTVEVESFPSFLWFVRRHCSNPYGHTDGLVMFIWYSDASDGQTS